jgi:hypothetical protein
MFCMSTCIAPVENAQLIQREFDARKATNPHRDQRTEFMARRPDPSRANKAAIHPTMLSSMVPP